MRSFSPLRFSGQNFGVKYSEIGFFSPYDGVPRARLDEVVQRYFPIPFFVKPLQNISVY